MGLGGLGCKEFANNILEVAAIQTFVRLPFGFSFGVRGLNEKGGNQPGFGMSRL